MKINNILKSIKQLNITFNGNNAKLYKSLLDEIDKNLLQKEEDLIIRISNYYNLDVEDVKKKFLRKQKRKKINMSIIPYEEVNDEKKETSIRNNMTPLLYKFDLNNTKYYIECIDNGNVYDENKNIVGIFKNNNIILNI